MIISKPKDLLKMFLKDWNYAVLHEAYSNYECYFCAIEKKDVNNPYIIEALESYIKKYPVESFVSSISKNYILQNKNSLYFIFIDKVSLSDPFFIEKTQFIKENCNNILSKKMLGEVVDISTHIDKKITHYKRKILRIINK